MLNSVTLQGLSVKAASHLVICLYSLSPFHPFICSSPFSCKQNEVGTIEGWKESRPDRYEKLDILLTNASILRDGNYSCHSSITSYNKHDKCNAAYRIND